jgi:hypothetical protein
MKMTRTNALAAITAMLSAVAVGAQSPGPGGAVQGWVVARRTTVDSGAGLPQNTISSRIAGSANKLRTEINSSLAGTTSNIVTIVDLATRTRTSLDTRQRTYRVRQISPLDAGITIEEVDHARTVKDLGSGGNIAGFPTKHYSIDARATLRYSVGSRSCDVTRLATSELWTTTDSTAIAVLKQQAEMARTSTGSKSPTTPNGGPPGAALRSIIKQRVRLTDGRQMELTVTNEVTEARRSMIEVSQFAPPSAFKRMPDFPPTAEAQADSIRRVTSARVFSRMMDSTPVAPGETRHCTATKH